MTTEQPRSWGGALLSHAQKRSWPEGVEYTIAFSDPALGDKLAYTFEECLDIVLRHYKHIDWHRPRRDWSKEPPLHSWVVVDDDQDRAEIAKIYCDR